MAYTNNVPQANQTFSATQGPILNNFAFIQDAIGQEHNFNAADATQTYHLQAAMPNAGLDPPPLPAGTNGVYYVSNGDAHFLSGTTICRMTDGSAITNGYQWLGRVMLQWGTYVPGGSVPNTGNISFAAGGFPNACFVVQATPVYGANQPSVSASVIIRSDIGTPSKTQFTYRFNGLSNDVTGFFWLAIGN